MQSRQRRGPFFAVPDSNWRSKRKKSKAYEASAEMGAEVDYDIPNDGVLRIPLRHLELQQQPAAALPPPPPLPQEPTQEMVVVHDPFWFLKDLTKDYAGLSMDERNQMVSHI